MMLALGQGVVKDCKEAAEWYQKAAEQDFPDAELHLGELLYRGDPGWNRTIPKLPNGSAKLRATAKHGHKTPSV